jgi:hypothetical protein
VHRLTLTLIAAFLSAVPLALYAQTPGQDEDRASDTAQPEQEGEERKEGPPKDEELVVKEIPGDVLILESGSRMTGVQVIRATPQFYEVEVIDGLRFEIPRRRVKEVIYDDVDPVRDQLQQQLFPEQQEVTIESGERVTSALRDQLMAPVSAEALSYQNQDFVEALEAIKTAGNLNLRIHPSIRELPAHQRRWTIEVPADRTLLALLREDLVAAFDFVEVIFEADRIIVLTKDAAVKRAASPPGTSTDPQPGAESPPAEPPQSE